MSGGLGASVGCARVGRVDVDDGRVDDDDFRASAGARELAGVVGSGGRVRVVGRASASVRSRRCGSGVGSGDRVRSVGVGRAGVVGASASVDDSVGRCRRAGARARASGVGAASTASASTTVGVVGSSVAGRVGRRVSVGSGRVRASTSGRRRLSTVRAGAGVRYRFGSVSGVGRRSTVAVRSRAQASSVDVDDGRHGRVGVGARGRRASARRATGWAGYGARAGGSVSVVAHGRSRVSGRLVCATTYGTVDGCRLRVRFVRYGSGRCVGSSGVVGRRRRRRRRTASGQRTARTGRSVSGRQVYGSVGRCQVASVRRVGVDDDGSGVGRSGYGVAYGRRVGRCRVGRASGRRQVRVRSVRTVSRIGVRLTVVGATGADSVGVGAVGASVRRCVGGRGLRCQVAGCGSVSGDGCTVATVGRSTGQVVPVARYGRCVDDSATTTDDGTYGVG